ncbi:preprotein translocase subunit SecG [Metarhizobium album]|uniref:preprotein translocase subunit SecG n=1 Tax=Metarhizobium album TaxID=2182425 RepID=UPI000A66933A|nr:preprotein translocase subunit SecG [Rhizobium album]
MQTVLIVVHLMIVLALVGVVLIQRSEGGGLGIGGGSGFMSARGTANALTRTTAILATLFFITSLAMGILARYESRPSDILDRIQSTTGQGNGVLDQLGGTTNTNGQQPAADTDGAVPATGDAQPTTGNGTSTTTTDTNTTGVPTGQ